MIQKLSYKFNTKEEQITTYFKVLSTLNNLDLQLNDLTTLVWLAQNKELDTASKKELCKTYNIKEGNLNNVLSRLRKLGLVSTNNKVTTLIPILNNDYSNTLNLVISLTNVPEN